MNTILAPGPAHPVENFVASFVVNRVDQFRNVILAHLSALGKNSVPGTMIVESAPAINFLPLLPPGKCMMTR